MFKSDIFFYFFNLYRHGVNSPVPDLIIDEFCDLINSVLRRKKEVLQDSRLVLFCDLNTFVFNEQIENGNLDDFVLDVFNLNQRVKCNAQIHPCARGQYVLQ